MTGPSPPRKPRAFSADDPAIVAEPKPATTAGGDARPNAARPSGPVPASRRSLSGEIKGGIRWGAILASAMIGLATLAAGVAFARFVDQALAREDWVGWLAFALLVTGGLALFVIVAKELWGLMRLARLGALKSDVAAALRDKDPARERKAVLALQKTYATREDLRWGLDRLREHARDVQDPGDLLKLADREVMAPLDQEARRAILKSAKRVATVTALSPIMWIAMIYVLAENLSLLRKLAALYGGRPGTAGALRLAGMVVSHIIATGGVAMTDDLLGQFLGQDLVRRLSRRLGEGLFNGALTARIGVAAIQVVRPLPFLDAEEVRVRDLVREIFRRTPGEAAENQANDKTTVA